MHLTEKVRAKVREKCSVGIAWAKVTHRISARALMGQKAREKALDNVRCVMGWDTIEACARAKEEINTHLHLAKARARAMEKEAKVNSFKEKDRVELLRWKVVSTRMVFGQNGKSRVIR